MVHAELTQVTTMLAGWGQAWGQLPQWSMSDVRSTQAPSQQLRPSPHGSVVVQPSTQVPLLHLCPGGQAGSQTTSSPPVPEVVPLLVLPPVPPVPPTLVLAPTPPPVPSAPESPESHAAKSARALSQMAACVFAPIPKANLFMTKNLVKACSSTGLDTLVRRSRRRAVAPAG